MRKLGTLIAVGLALVVGACAPESESEEASDEGTMSEVVAVKEVTPGLLARVKVNAEQARAVVAARIPAGEITAAELEEEDGHLIYSFAVTVQGVSGIEEVNVDALMGQIASHAHEDAAMEAKEAADEENEADEPDEANEKPEGARVPPALQR